MIFDGAFETKRSIRVEECGVVLVGSIIIFLQMANHMRDSNSEPDQVWKWDLQPM